MKICTYRKAHPMARMDFPERQPSAGSGEAEDSQG
jgi:hypothetical protein